MVRYVEVQKLMEDAQQKLEAVQDNGVEQELRMEAVAEEERACRRVTKTKKVRRTE